MACSSTKVSNAPLRPNAVNKECVYSRPFFYCPMRTAMKTTESPDARVIAPTVTEVTGEPQAKPAIPAFKFPFSPASYAPGKNDGQAWHAKGNKSAHEKKIGPAPNGTRRSMGKR